MTEETRAELRRGIENLVRESLRDSADVEATVWGPIVSNGGWSHFTQVEVSSAAIDLLDAPPLTTAQQLALSVLVGEPDRVVLSALCDLLIDMGHEYGLECYEKGKREEQDRIRNLVLSYANGADPEQSAASVMYGLYEKL